MASTGTPNPRSPEAERLNGFESWRESHADPRSRSRTGFHRAARWASSRSSISPPSPRASHDDGIRQVRLRNGEGDAAVPEGEPQSAGQLSRRPSAQSRRTGPGQVRRLLHVLDGLPGPLHRHRRRPRRPGRTAEKYPEMFVIDELRCIYCGMCEQACPVRRDRVDVAVRSDRPEPGRDDVRQGETAERLRSDGRRPGRTQCELGPASSGRRPSCRTRG